MFFDFFFFFLVQKTFCFIGDIYFLNVGFISQLLFDTHWGTVLSFTVEG